MERMSIVVRGSMSDVGSLVETINALCSKFGFLNVVAWEEDGQMNLLDLFLTRHDGTMVLQVIVEPPPGGRYDKLREALKEEYFLFEGRIEG